MLQQHRSRVVEMQLHLYVADTVLWKIEIVLCWFICPD